MKAKETGNMEAVLTDIRLELDNDARSKFIEKYIPFILKQVSKYLGRYVCSENEEAYIVGMEAFNEAIDRFDGNKGGFFSFAALTINSRLIDHYRKERKHNENIVSFDGSINTADPVDMTEGIGLRQEMWKFLEISRKFGIEMEYLAKKAPTHIRTRHEMTQLGMDISKADDLTDKIYANLQLPIKEISERFQITAKRIKTFKIYLIAVVIIYKEDLRAIMEYLEPGGVK